MTKRRHEDTDVDEIIDSINMKNGLRAAGLSSAVFKRARLGLPSFSTVKWADFSREYGHPAHLGLTNFNTPRYYLPPSLHEALFETGKMSIEKRLIRIARKQESDFWSRYYIVLIIALFHGRVTDQPEHAMAPTRYSTGGDFEHEFLMIGGILFFVIEFKLGIPNHDNLAQLFLELLSAAEQNSNLDFAGLRIYGLLADLSQFKFYSYAPPTKEFSFDERILVDITRTKMLSNMIDVCNKIFGVLLTGYIDGLQAIIRRSKDSSSQTLRTGRKSTDQWEAALRFSQCCVEKFNEPVVSIQEIETRGNGALELLTKSVHSIPRAYPFSGDKDPLTQTELKALTVENVKEEHECYLSQGLANKL